MQLLNVYGHGENVITAVEATKPDETHHIGKLHKMQQDEQLQRCVQECKRQHSPQHRSGS